MDLCLNRATLPLNTPATEVVLAAHAAGFGGIEMSARRLLEAVQSERKVRELITGGGITPVHGGWSIRLHWERERFNQALPTVASEMAAVARLGSRSGALVLPRKAPASGQALPHRDELIDRMRLVGDLAANQGLNLVIEFNGLRPKDPPECGYRTLSQTLELVHETGCSNIGFLVDSYHWHASGGTEEEIAAIPVDVPMFVHLNDAPNLSVDALDDSMRVLPGHGCIDLSALLSGLDRRCYSGPLSIELKNPDLHSKPAFEAAKLAYDAGIQLLRRFRQRETPATA
ncbi:sugar phosphate isomerase/epimerase family protein [Streptomyces albidoflavus]